MPEILNVFVQISSLLIWALIWIILIQVVMSWLIAFNVINLQNDGMRQFLNFLERVTDPLYRPVRAILPDFSGLDFSPIVVLLVLNLLQRVIAGIQLN